MRIRTAIYAACSIWLLSATQSSAAEPQRLDVMPNRYDYMLLFPAGSGPSRFSPLPTVNAGPSNPSPYVDIVVCNDGGTPGNYWPTMDFSPNGRTLDPGACVPIYHINDFRISNTWRAQVYIRISAQQ